MRYFGSFIAGVFLLIIVTGVPAHAFPSLEELERSAGDGPEAMSAAAAMGRDGLLEELERQRQGPKYFLNAGYGYSDEPQYVGSDNTVSYGKLEANGGISFPLFGSWSRLKINRLKAEADAADSASKAKLLKLLNVSAIRGAYAVLWTESIKIKAAECFLTGCESADKILTARQSESLVLRSDRLEFMAAFETARRDIAMSQLRKVQALQIMRLATGRELEMPESLPVPSLPVFASARADVDGSPVIESRRAAVRIYEKIADETNRPDREGSVVVGVSGSREAPGGYGSGAYIGFSMSEPLKTAASGQDKARLAAMADLDRAKREELYERMKLDGEAEEAMAWARYAEANIAAQRVKLSAVSEGVREKLLRRKALAGDTFEQLQAGRYQYYLRFRDMIDSYLIFVQSGADVLRAAYPAGIAAEPPARVSAADDTSIEALLSPAWFAGDGSLSKRAAQTQAAEHTVIMPERGFSIYVWDASGLLASDASRKNTAALMKARGVTRALISFSADELRQILDGSNAPALRSALSELKTHGISTELLLGDPEWLLAGKRASLLSVIKKMSSFDFNGVHLDIEPDSLPDAASKRPEYAAALADTVNEAASAYGAPVSFSVHPRYLEGALGDVMTGRLRPPSVSYIAPMIYSADVNTTASRMDEILNRYQGFRFAPAQSVESSIPKSESWRSAGLKNFTDAMQALTLRLSSHKNFRGLIIQDWNNLKEM